MESMSTAFESFADRRSPCKPACTDLRERRQFANSHSDLSVEARQLANAIDRYKLRHRRRYIDYEEILAVIKALGYRQTEEAAEQGE
jgi:hypothetical protein